MASENERQAFAKRLNEALDDAGAPKKNDGRQKWVAKAFDVSDIAAWKWMNGATMPRAERIQKIASKAKVRAEWLQFGVEPKRALRPRDIPWHPDQVRDETLVPVSYTLADTLSAEQTELLELLTTLSEDDRKAVLRIARALAATQED
jgi:transcriptional regulator with XRE-family HTH domain